MRVFVYYNLHRKLWSIKALEGERKGKVIGHAARVNLRDCVFKVSEAGRQRVLRERRKNVHAGVVGTLGGATDILKLSGATVTYNPYKCSTFVIRGTVIPVTEARYVYMECYGNNTTGVYV